MKIRRPWLAFGMSMVCPGLGQLYNGNGILALTAFPVGIIFALTTTFYFFGDLKMLLQALCISLVIDFVYAVHAYREAKRLGAVNLKPFQRWWLYLGFLVVSYGIPDGYGKIYPSRFLSFQIPSESMLPNLLVGDRLVADGWAYWGKDPARGDIVVFDYPKDTSIKYVKRLVALPGETVEMREGEIYVNGARMEQRRNGAVKVSSEGWSREEFLEKLGEKEHSMYRTQPAAPGDFAPVVVPEGKFFVMGDNRDRSSDSRVWGFVSREHLIGRMAYVFFSWDTNESRIRTERIGLKVE